MKTIIILSTFSFRIHKIYESQKISKIVLILNIFFANYSASLHLSSFGTSRDHTLQDNVMIH